MATLIDQIKALAIRNATEFKSVRAAIALLPGINDSASGTTSVYSSSKTESRMAAVALQVKNDLTNGVGSALDTLKEISDALGGDSNFAGTMLNALAKRVRVDAAQSFTSGEQAQARSNINVFSKDEIGDVNTDFVSVFNTALL